MQKAFTPSPGSLMSILPTIYGWRTFCCVSSRCCHVACRPGVGLLINVYSWYRLAGSFITLKECCFCCNRFCMPYWSVYFSCLRYDLWTSIFLRLMPVEWGGNCERYKLSLRQVASGRRQVTNLVCTARNFQWNRMQSLKSGVKVENLKSFTRK